MQPTSVRRILLSLATLAVAACGGDAPREETPPPPPGLRPGSPTEFRGTASAALPPGTCEPATGDLIGRAGLRGAMYAIEPVREILVLDDANGALRYYRDLVVGPGGYTVLVDLDSDSAWAMDRRTRTWLSGSVSDFSTRADFGPPVAIADSVRRRCRGVAEAPPQPEETPRPD